MNMDENDDTVEDEYSAMGHGLGSGIQQIDNDEMIQEREAEEEESFINEATSAYSQRQASIKHNTQQIQDKAQNSSNTLKEQNYSINQGLTKKQ